MPFQIDDYPTATSGVAEENNVFDEPTYSSSVSMKFPFLIFLLFIYLFLFFFFFGRPKPFDTCTEIESETRKKKKEKILESNHIHRATRKERLFKLNSRICIWLANFCYKSISNINKLFVHQKLLLDNVYHINEESRWSEFAVWHGFRWSWNYI